MTWVSWFPDTALKGFVLLAAAWIVSRLLKKQPAALRHLVWSVTLGGLLAMPLLSAATPLQLSLPSRVVAATPSEPTVAREIRTPAPQRPGAPALISAPPVAQSPTTSLIPSWSVTQWLIAAWIFGTVVLAIRFINSLVVTTRLRRTALGADDRLTEALDHAAARAGLGTPPELVVTNAVAMPCAFGWQHPVIVLPAEARGWTRDRLDVVLLHESTHIRRGDYITHLVAEVARIVHWYNPLVWIASRSLRAEAERATDEGVISAGATASDYAGHLLDIVRGAGAQRIPATLLPLAMRSEFEGRLIAILEYAGVRRLRTRTAALTLALGAGLAGVVASIGAASPVNKPDATVNPVTAIAEIPGPKHTAPKQQSAQSLPEAMATVRALIDAINDSVPSVRLAVVNALSATRDTVVVRELMRVLREDDNAEVRRAAAHSLGRIEDPLAVPALTDALLKDRDVEVRRNAASALGSMENEQGASALAQALDSDDDLEVRVNSAEALGSIRGPTSVNALSRALGRASDSKLKIAVIEALDGHDDTRSTPALTAALRDATAGVRAAAAHALDGVEDAGVIPALIGAARDDDVEVRRAVIDALNNFEDRRLVDVFANALTDRDPEIRASAASGLGNIEDLRTAPRQLVAALDDANAEVRHEAAHAIGHIQDPATLSALIARVSDPVAEVRQAVVESLSEFSEPAATAALQKALRDSDPEVRKTAAEALGDRKRK